MFYVAFGYSISYLPCAVLAGALSGGSAPGLAPAPHVADRERCLAGCDIVEPSAVLLDDRRCTAALIQQAAGKRLAER